MLQVYLDNLNEVGMLKSDQELRFSGESFFVLRVVRIAEYFCRISHLPNSTVRESNFAFEDRPERTTTTEADDTVAIVRPG